MMMVFRCHGCLIPSCVGMPAPITAYGGADGLWGRRQRGVSEGVKPEWLAPEGLPRWIGRRRWEVEVCDTEGRKQVSHTKEVVMASRLLLQANPAPFPGGSATLLAGRPPLSRLGTSAPPPHPHIAIQNTFSIPQRVADAHQIFMPEPPKSAKMNRKGFAGIS
jgi:hypothetical protein